MNINSMLRYGILAGIFALPFVFFIVPGSMFFPFITGKNFTFRIGVEIITALWLILMLRDRAYAPRRTPVLVAFAALIALSTISDLFGVRPWKSVWSNYERMEGLVQHLHYFALFLVAGSVLTRERLWDWFFKVSIAASVIMSMYGLMQLSGNAVINQGGVRLDGRMGNAAYLAIYMLIHMFLSAVYFVRAKNLAPRLLYGGIIVLEGVILYYTATRGAMLGLIAGVFVAALLVALFGREYPKARKAAAGALAAAVLVVGGFLLVRNAEFVRESPVLSRFASISLEEKTTKSRFMVWNMAWQGFKERPVLGWGHENFNFVFNKYYDPRMYDQEQWFDRTHNVLLDWLIAGGVLGLGAYLALLASLVYVLWRKTDLSVIDKSIISGLLAGYFVHNLFVFDYLGSYVMLFMIAAYAHSLAAWKGEKEPRNAHAFVSDDVSLYGAVPVAAVLLVAAIYFVNVRPMSANTSLVRALQAQSDPAAALEHYKKAVSYGTFGNAEIRERLLTAASGVPDGAPNRAEFVAYAKEQMTKHIEDNPGDARYELFLGSFLSQTGDFVGAIARLNKASELSPRKQAIIIEKGVAYLTMRDFPKALAALKQAYELEPAYEDGKIIYGIGALYAGDKKLASEILAGLDEKKLAFDERLLSAYVNMNDFATAASLLRKRVAYEPQNPQWRLSLAAAFLKMGDRQSAISMLESVKELNKDYAPQVQNYIDQIKAGKNPVQ